MSELFSGANKIIQADNLEFLTSVPDESVTMIYIDPPFNTGRTQKRASTTTIRVADGKGDRVGFGGHSYETLRGALASYDDAFTNYWDFLEPRLEQAWRILAEDGRLHFQLDYREVHKAKVMLDMIVGRDHFLNEII